MPPKATFNRLLTDIQTHLKRQRGVDECLSDPRLKALHHFCMQWDVKAIKTQLVTQTRFIVIDTETTGLHAYAGDEMIAICLLEMRGLEFTGHQYETLINPKRPIPASSTAIHGLQDSDVVNSPHLSDILGDVLEFIGESVLVGHHIGFDLHFLNKATKKQLLCKLRHPWLDTMLLHTAYTGQIGHYTLDEVTQFLRVHNPARHSACGDALATALIFQKLVTQFISSSTSINDLINLQFEVGHF